MKVCHHKNLEVTSSALRLGVFAVILNYEKLKYYFNFATKGQALTAMKRAAAQDFCCEVELIEFLRKISGDDYYAVSSGTHSSKSLSSSMFSS